MLTGRVRASGRSSSRRRRPFGRCRRRACRDCVPATATRARAGSQPVIDHDEAAGGQHETLAIDAGDIFSARRLLERRSSLGGELLADRIEFTPAQGVEQIAGEDHLLPLSPREPLLDQVIGARRHGGLHLGAEAAATKKCRLAGNQLAIDPGGARRLDLRVDVEIGPHRQRDTAPALGIVELAQLHDRPGRAVAGRVEVGQLDVMRAAIDAVDHGIGGAFQLVVEAAIKEPADNAIANALAGKHITRRSPLNAALGERPVHALDDVAAFAERAQRRFGLVRDDPLARAGLMGEAEGFELAQPADLLRQVWVGLSIRMRREVNDAVLTGIADKLPVEPRPALGIDLVVQAPADVEVGARPKLLGDEILRPRPHALADVVPRDDEVLPVVGAAALALCRAGRHRHSGRAHHRYPFRPAGSGYRAGDGACL